MRNILTAWYKRYFSDPEAVILVLTLVSIVILFWLFGSILTPVLVSVVIAYLLDGVVKLLEKWKFPHVLAVSIVCLCFVGLLLVSLIWILPLLWQQLTNLFNELPEIMGRGQNLLMTLPQKYPSLISADQITSVTATLKSESGNIGKAVLSFSISTIPGIIEVIVYVVLVPMLVFFFLKDSKTILHWLAKFLPKKRKVLGQVWQDVNAQIGNYVRGRVLEMIIVSVVTSITFKLFDLQYAILLGVLVGVATIIPYIGAVVSTIPVIIIAFVQWGWSAHFAYLLIAFAVISVVDSNILVPLLFSGTMNMHPVAIIVAVIFFGGIWGFWGVFFAIPLATVVKAVITAWPHKS